MYSFTDFGGRTSNTQVRQENKREDGKGKYSNYKEGVTERQVQFYMDLCKQKRVAPINYMKLTYDEFSKVIEELKNFYPASEGQIQLIKDKIASLADMGVVINEPNYSELTGGRGGTASKKIEALIQLERENADKAPVREEQVKTLVSMYLCPDIPFEDYGVEKRITYPDGTWSRMSPNEFAEEIKSKITRREASRIIDQYRGVFYTWKKTRIKSGQIDYIRQLEDRMADISKPRICEYAVVNGEITQVWQSSSKDNRNNVTAYTPLADVELMMFSVEDASNYIDILKSELDRKELIQYRETTDGSMTFESLRQKKEKKENPMKVLQDLIFKLDANSGYENEIAHEAVTPYLFEDDVDERLVENAKKEIREYMVFLVENKYVSLNKMMEICQDSEVAQHILLGM